ncbi:MAG: thioredoxin domain-containing protein, partial [Verrucomicrobia bacterium]|nr:thioredoxin domain-containing protein [Verrucomicrobiota bacterium]
MEKTNGLAGEVSPYLLQHAHNPVDWMPWGESVWRRAKAENKPVFLSIGYSTCHWCHVMERESFESEDVAAVLNRDFIPVKVDREERPDVDRLYMTAVQAMTGQGGWPLSVWVTPEGKPFYGGTYFPPNSAHGRPGFLDVLRQISSAWRERSGEVLGWAEELTDRIQTLGQGTGGERISDADKILRSGTDEMAMEYDRKNGGFGGAPKFPRPSQPLFLLRRFFAEKDLKLLEMMRHTGRAMRAGGIYDQIGGGFHRYAVDGEWAVPHFEKMLYDNAQLMGWYAELGAALGESWPNEVVAGIDRYLWRDLRVEGGGLGSAEDADSEGVEGKFYVWTRKEVMELAEEGEMRLAEEVWGVTEAGNFVVLEGLREKLEKRREGRVRPGKDDKVLASWNALAISGYAKAARWGGGSHYAKRAEEIWGFLEQNVLRKDGTPTHRWRNGKKDDAHLLEDYAGVLQALIDLHQVTLKVEYLRRAVDLAGRMLDKFEDKSGGGLWASADETLMARMKDDYDG